MEARLLVATQREKFTEVSKIAGVIDSAEGPMLVLDISGAEKHVLAADILAVEPYILETPEEA